MGDPLLPLLRFPVSPFLPFVLRRLRFMLHYHFATVMAPSDADETAAAYLANTPQVYRGAGAFQLASRSLICASVNSTFSCRFLISNTTISPSRNAAIGPPTAA